MLRIYRQVLCIVLCALCVACSDDDNQSSSGSKNWHDVKVAVVLPMNNGLDIHWKRTLELLSENMSQAFSNQSEGIRFSYEWYDESSADIAALSEELAGREDITAIIGGLYSSNTQVMAATFADAGKTFFTLGTTEELVRAYADGGNLWAMTETDITQCEVLLSKALYYGAKSVSLLANEEDAYGKTFIDWFAFQASELGLNVNGIYSYTEPSLSTVSSQAAASKADYVICIPSEVADIRPILEAFQNEAKRNGQSPRTLFSDTAYGADVIGMTGNLCEGLEGVAFGADPESGFEVSYETFFGEQATLGEAQVYDAAMLLGYASYYCLLHPEANLQTALQKVVSGREQSMGSWMAEDMRLIIDALSVGGTPDVRGASSSLDFDAKVFTNVLHTTYYNFKIYGGRYILLDYNTSDGSKRTDATLAGWNWKAAQMQDFDETEEFTYPALDKKWALLVAASTGWSNYRHQADVLAMYQILKRRGYQDDHIVLIMEDDIAYNSRNQQQGVVQVKIGGENQYQNVQKDYRLTDLSPQDIKRILNGEKSNRLPQVIEAGANDNVLVFWSGHGSDGQLCWADDYAGFNRYVARETVTEMSEYHRFRKVLFLIETCYSGSVANACEGIPGALFITAASESETSKADVYNEDMRVWMSNRFTSTLQEQISEDASVSLRDLYYRLFINTVGSHVKVYNASYYGNIYKQSMEEFL